MAILFTEGMVNILTTLLVNVLTELVGKVLDFYNIPSALSLALTIRVVLIQAARERKIRIGKKEKMELIYDYLTGTEFRNRVEAIIESFRAMKIDLDTEKRAMEKLWAKREKQIERVLLNIGGMHGDLEGIAGKTLPVVKALELPSK